MSTKTINFTSNTTVHQTTDATTGVVTFPIQQVSVGQIPSGNPSFSRGWTLSDQYVFCRRGTYVVAFALADLMPLAIAYEPNLSYAPSVTTQPGSASCVASSTAGTFTAVFSDEFAAAPISTATTYAWYESADGGTTFGSALSSSGIYSGATTAALTITPVAGILTSTNTEITDGDTVTIGSTVYRFKNTMAAAYDVKRNGTTADTTLANLIKAINASGTPGSEYYAGTLANPLVTADASVTSHKVTVRGIAAGSITTTKSATQLSWNNATLASKTGCRYKCTATNAAGSTSTVPAILTVT